MSERNGVFRLHDLKPVAKLVTHELLVECWAAVCDVCSEDSGRERARMLAKLVAKAVGGFVEKDGDTLLKVGKRLVAQADAVRSRCSPRHSEGVAAGDLNSAT